VKDLKSITDSAAGSEARRQEGPEAAHAFSGFEPMTIRQLLLRDGVGGQSPALFGSWVSFDARGLNPRDIVCLQAPRRHLAWRGCLRSCPQYDGVTGPSVV
jgi:hypothetical protein